MAARWPRGESRERWAAYVRRTYGDSACGAKGLRGSGPERCALVRLASFFGLLWVVLGGVDMLGIRAMCVFLF